MEKTTEVKELFFIFPKRKRKHEFRHRWYIRSLNKSRVDQCEVSMLVKPMWYWERLGLDTPHLQQSKAWLRCVFIYGVRPAAMYATQQPKPLHNVCLHRNYIILCVETSWTSSRHEVCWGLKPSGEYVYTIVQQTACLYNHDLNLVTVTEWGRGHLWAPKSLPQLRSQRKNDFWEGMQLDSTVNVCRKYRPCKFNHRSSDANHTISLRQIKPSAEKQLLDSLSSDTVRTETLSPMARSKGI